MAGSSVPVLAYSDEALVYLDPQTAADLERQTTQRQKKRAQAIADIEAKGGILHWVETTESWRGTHTVEDTTQIMLAQPKAVQAACLEAARKIWPTATEERKGFLLACFPERADWAAELANTTFGHRDLLLSTLADPALIVAVAKRFGLAACIINIVPKLGVAAVPVFEELFELARFPNEEKALSRSLGCIGTPEAAALFVKHLRKKNVRSYATEFFARFPHLAEPALGEVAKKKTQVAEVARLILSSLERKEGAADEENVEEASPKELPEVLRNPPWVAKPKKRTPKSVELPIPKEPLVLHWTPRERLRFVAHRCDNTGIYRDGSDVQRLTDQLEKGMTAYLYANYPPELSIPLLENPRPNVTVWNETPGQMLAMHGERILNAVVTNFADKLSGPARFLVESPLIAVQCARLLMRKFGLAEPLAWLDRFPKTAALGLIPIALSPTSEWRAGAEIGLRHLARKGHRAMIEELAPKEIADVLDAPDAMPKKAPKMPTIYRVDELRVPRLKNGKKLPRSAVELLDQLLAASSLDMPLPVFDQIREACEPRSLAEHAWDLAKVWDLNGAKGSAIWMLHSIAHIGDDEVVRRLTPALKGEGIAQMLGAIGTDAALMELSTILVRVTKTNKARPKYAWGTETAIELIALKRGVPVSEIQDHFVPTCDVGPEGIPLDLGSKTYRLTFDSQLNRVLLDEKGERVANLPRKSDDPEKLAAATTLLEDLEEDIAAIAERRALSLEEAMLSGRSWSIQDFGEDWINHPLSKQMARGVVWESGGKTFRIAEDGSFANADDDHLPVTDEIRVAHVADMPKDEVAKWRQIFADYELLQPFEQLAREPAKLTPEQLESTQLTIAAPTMAVGELHTTMSRMFSRAGASFACPVRDVLCLVRVHGKELFGSFVRNGAHVPFKDVDAVGHTELLRALAPFT